ncbi:MAG: PIN domain-containing protein [Gemmatimonadaceae bacterium]
MSGTPEIAVVDTHALIWWITGTMRRLGRGARSFVDLVDSGRAVACIPTVSLVELSEAIQSGGVTLGIPFADLVDRLESAPSRYNVVALTSSIVSRSHDLFSIPERGDRLIAATAMELGIPLVTRDPQIAKAAQVDVLW